MIGEDWATLRDERKRRLRDIAVHLNAGSVVEVKHPTRDASAFMVFRDDVVETALLDSEVTHLPATEIAAAIQLYVDNFRSRLQWSEP